jgi:glycosyltransferase involved in cell wall biosynthesis
VKPAKIGIDARLTYYTSGGISNYIRQLVAVLPGLDTQNSYRILQSRKAGETLSMPANAQRVSCITPAHHRLERLALGVELLPQGLTLLHSPDFIPPHGAFKSVITIHDLTFLHYPQFLTANSRRYYNDQIHDAVKRADAILCDSEATRRDVLNLLPVPDYKATTIHLAPDPIYQPQPLSHVEAVTARYKLSPGGYLLFVGTFEPRKNVMGLLDAYSQLPNDAPPLVLVGNTGWLFDETIQKIQTLGLTSKVRFLVDAQPGHMPVLYSGASLLVLPSHYEGFGLPVLEAFACNVPVVIADRASLPEIAGGAAALCDPDDPASIATAIQQVLSDSAYRDSLVEKGKERLKGFSWEKCASETLAVYKKVMEQR